MEKHAPLKSKTVTFLFLIEQATLGTMMKLLKRKSKERDRKDDGGKQDCKLIVIFLTLKEPGFLDPSHSQDLGNRLTKHQVCGTSGYL